MPERPTVLALHGWLGRGADWLPVAGALTAAGVEADWLTPGPGSLGLGLRASELRAPFDGVADGIVRLLDAEGVGRAVVAGYSMGGRLALHFALTHPARVAGLVLVGASPGLPDEKERAARRALDRERAAALRADPDAFLNAWYAMPLWDPLDDAARARLVADRKAHLDVKEAAAALEAFSVGAQPWLGDRLHEIRVPTVLLAGAIDAKFAALARRMAGAPSTSPDAARIEAVVVPDAGHALLTERPDAVASAVKRVIRESGNLGIGNP